MGGPPDVVHRVARSEGEDPAVSQIDLDAALHDVQEFVLVMGEGVAELSVGPRERHRVEPALIAVDEHPTLALGVGTPRPVRGPHQCDGGIAVVGGLVGAREQLELARAEGAGDFLERPDARPGEAAFELTEERVREFRDLRDLNECQAAGMAKASDAGSDSLGLHIRRNIDGGGHDASITDVRAGDERGDGELTRGNDRDTRRKRALRNVTSVERINIPLAARRCAAAPLICPPESP